MLQQVNGEVNGGLTSSCSCQPIGHMTWEILHQNMLNFPDANTMKVSFVFPEGIQTEKHPHPGQPFAATRLCSFLPDNHEGKTVLKLLEKAFYQQLLFTIAATEHGDVITPAFPLTTQLDEEGHKIDGYLDLNYLKNLRKALRKEGIK